MPITHVLVVFSHESNRVGVQSLTGEHKHSLVGVLALRVALAS